MNKLLLIIPAIVFSLATNAQLAKYEFNTNTKDQVGGYDATIIGSPLYIDGEYISMDSADYLILPDTLQSAFDTNSSLELKVRFKVEGDYRATVGEEARIIFSSKDKYFQPAGGFDVTAREWEGQLQIITTFGDGVLYEPGGCITCCPSCNHSEGKLDFVGDIEPGIWYNFSVKFIFDTGEPYILYSFNNSVSISYFDERLDFEGFLSTLSRQQIVVGADKDNEILNQGFPSLKLNIDYLTIASPVLPGDQNELGEVLRTLTDYVNGTISLNSTELDSLQGLFVNNWDDNSFSANRDIVLEYMESYAANYGPIFDQDYKEKPIDFPPLEGIQYAIQQWIIDNQYGPSTVHEMEGVIFEDHEQFPGIVSAAAPRLTGVTFTIDGDYQTDPGFVLNGQEYARRPTGYYVPPGELVNISVPEIAVNKGLTLYVGAHNKNVQETWSEFCRFPRISTTYQIDTNAITVANPFGGGIYITVPDGSKLGALQFTVDGAVKAPYYCTKEGFSNSLVDFWNDISNQYVPWLDMESSKFMCTVSAGTATLMTYPDSILSIWDKTFDAFNIALGRPLNRFRGEYLIVDRQGHVKYTAAPADYPMSLETTKHPYTPDLVLPVAVQEGRDWYQAFPYAFHYIICHEFGHLHNMPTLILGQEANVNMPATAVYNLVMGETIDSAFMYSIQQQLNLKEAALDWILTPIFYNGYRMGWDTINMYQTQEQMAYQSRGFAKLVDIANMFGWEALGNIMGYFYEHKLENPDWDPYALGDDEFIEAASLRMGFNMAPHFEFWGIIPSDSLVQKLDTMPVSEVIKERIIDFRSIVPANNEAFQPIYNIMISKLESHHHERYNTMMAHYDSAYAQKIIERIDTILFKYYDFDSTFFNQSPVITGLNKPIVIEQNSSAILTLSNLIVEDPDNIFPDDFSLTIKGGTNYSVSGDTIIPTECFAGLLSVPVIVSDGIEESVEYIITIEVTELSGVDIQTACNSFIWIDGITYTKSNNTATHTLTNSLGCDSVVTLDLIILESSTGTDVISACESYTWIDGITYTTSNNTATYILTNYVGCDSIATLNLTISDTCGTSAINETSKGEIRFYPNPVHDHLVVELPSANFSRIEIHDITGKKVLSGGINGKRITINKLEFETGAYILSVFNKEYSINSFLLIKN